MSLFIFQPYLKRTQHIDFHNALDEAATTVETKQLIKEIDNARRSVVNAFTATVKDSSVDSIVNATRQYASLLIGLCNNNNENSEICMSLSSSISVSWSNSVSAPPISNSCDAAFDLASWLENLGMWHVKRAALLLSKIEDMDESEAKEAFTLLLVSSGINFYTREAILPLLSAPESGSAPDMHSNTLHVYQNQTMAEAQEIVIQRAIEKKNTAILISGLCRDVANKMSNSAEVATKLKSYKWSLYLQGKSLFYQSMAHSFNGASLLNDEKCGDALASGQEAERLMKQANVVLDNFFKEKPRGDIKCATDVPLFRRNMNIVREAYAKSKRENDFIYFAKISMEVPELPEPKELVSIIEFSPIEINAKWSATAYQGFALEKIKKAPVSNVSSASTTDDICTIL